MVLKYLFYQLNEIPILHRIGNIEKNMFFRGGHFEIQDGAWNQGSANVVPSKICFSSSHLPLCQISQFYPDLHGSLCFFTQDPPLIIFLTMFSKRLPNLKMISRQEQKLWHCQRCSIWFWPKNGKYCVGCNSETSWNFVLRVISYRPSSRNFFFSIWLENLQQHSHSISHGMTPMRFRGLCNRLVEGIISKS